MKKLFALLALLPGLVWGQVNPSYVQGQVLTASSLNFNFSLAAAVTNGTLTNPTITNGTATGLLLNTSTFTGGTINGSTVLGISLPLTELASQAANTLVANGTGSAGSPTALAVPSCSTSSSALNWTTSGGAAALTCNTAINAAQLGGATFATPGPIGSTTAGTGAFTNLSSSGTVSGTGFSTYLASPPAIGGTAAAAGSFTTLSANSTVSGSGFSTYLASPPTIGGTTPGAVNASGGTINGMTIGTTTPGAAQFSTLTMTGLLTPVSTTGIKGTTTNDNAQAGSVGEFPNNATTNTSLTTVTNANATSTPLTAGDWDVECTATFNPAGSTTVSALQVGISTTSATFATANTGATTVLFETFTTGAVQIISSPLYRVQLASSGTAYCVVQATFGTSTMTVNGFIRARRPR